MPKAEITIPKGTKCKNGEICDKDLVLDLDIPETKPTLSYIPTASIAVSGQQQQILAPPQQVTHTHTEEKPKKLSHDEVKQLIPKGINAIECPGGDCGHTKLENPIQTKKYKKCPNDNCEANTLTKDSKFCPYCKKDIDEDEDLDDGIDLTEEEDE